jgi:hypothetical protein
MFNFEKPFNSQNQEQDLAPKVPPSIVGDEKTARFLSMRQNIKEALSKKILAINEANGELDYFTFHAGPTVRVIGAQEHIRDAENDLRLAIYRATLNLAGIGMNATEIDATVNGLLMELNAPPSFMKSL